MNGAFRKLPKALDLRNFNLNGKCPYNDRH